MEIDKKDIKEDIMEKPKIYLSNKSTPYIINFVILCNILIVFGVIDHDRVLLYHAIIQTVLFIVVAHIPSYLTGVMWWVDLAWPLGLITIAVYSYTQAQDTLKAKLICACYFLQGFRMALGGSVAIISGKWKTSKDLPRYEYQKILMEHLHGPGAFTTAHMQKEIYLQAVANYATLIAPIYIVTNDKVDIQALEIIGFTMWALSLVFEHTADLQKKGFIKDRSHPRDAICNVGLWKYSRHPNYFGEWMVWNSLIVVAM
jgi:steroid 5-alpha reductase family enzyme